MLFKTMSRHRRLIALSAYFKMPGLAVFPPHYIVDSNIIYFDTDEGRMLL